MPRVAGDAHAAAEGGDGGAERARPRSSPGCATSPRACRNVHREQAVEHQGAGAIEHDGGKQGVTPFSAAEHRASLHASAGIGSGRVRLPIAGLTRASRVQRVWCRRRRAPRRRAPLEAPGRPVPGRPRRSRRPALPQAQSQCRLAPPRRAAGRSPRRGGRAWSSPHRAPRGRPRSLAICSTRVRTRASRASCSGIAPGGSACSSRTSSGSRVPRGASSGTSASRSVLRPPGTTRSPMAPANVPARDGTAEPASNAAAHPRRAGYGHESSAVASSSPAQILLSDPDSARRSRRAQASSGHDGSTSARTGRFAACHADDSPPGTRALLQVV